MASQDDDAHDIEQVELIHAQIPLVRAHVPLIAQTVCAPAPSLRSTAIAMGLLYADRAGAIDIDKVLYTLELMRSGMKHAFAAGQLGLGENEPQA